MSVLTQSVREALAHPSMCSLGTVRIFLAGIVGSSLVWTGTSGAQDEATTNSESDTAAQDDAKSSTETTPSQETEQDLRAVRSQPGAEGCVAAHEKAVDHADSGRLLEARERFGVCVSSTCPSVIRNECARELSRLRAQVPSVVFAATNQAGNDVTDVTVTLNGKPIAHSLTSRAFPLDPGRYEFHLTSSDGTTEKRAIQLREGEQLRRVEVHFPGTEELELKVPEPAVVESPWTPPVVISTVTGALGLVSFGYFALAGTSMEGCAPHCTAGEVRSMRQSYAIADVSLLVGLAGITTALILYESPEEQAVQARMGAQSGGAFIETRWTF